ncbi:hypothetical protein ILUMI_12668 [Ignelater luminosus]|uniref:Serpin domain-containing protein n=1 Tax=Ignelater luminosus TaxID=2038154 RepID=A0A8K0CZ56_IGNLU|nr:hypothetical protein ILUMI_12668 [Ignelater luminosus]
MKTLILLVLVILASQAVKSQVYDDFLTEYNRFSARVYKELLKTNAGNFLICPLSVEIVLALIESGARGQTAKELSKTLGLPNSSDEINEIFSTIILNMQGNKKYELNNANKVYIKEGFIISNNFKKAALDIFKAEIQNINFIRNIESAKEINKWVEERTHNTIKNLMQPNDLDEHTRAVLVNAMYFRGRWTKPFEKEATEKRPFYLNANDFVDTEMMMTIDDYGYYENSKLNVKFLELPYEGRDVSMHIVLPNKKHGLNSLENRIEELLTPPLYSIEEVRIKIPKFKIESSIEFKPILKTLGIKSAFQDKADFSEIGAEQQNLTISKVVQKASIEVEERGTAVTSGEIAPGPEATAFFLKPKEFYADHPFIFYLRHNKLDINLFVGTFKFPQN